MIPHTQFTKSTSYMADDADVKVRMNNGNETVKEWYTYIEK